jgi:low temperature requirement protein LtrA
MAVPRAKASTAADPPDTKPKSRSAPRRAMTTSALDAPARGSERRTSPIELLWDLVFVFAVTQVTTLLSRDLAWRGLGRSLLVLALVWWAWSAFVWAANAEDEEAPALRLILLVAMVLIFIAGLAIPRAFAGEATLFAATYAGVRVLHLGLYADASRRGNASWTAIAGFALTVTIGMALLVAGALLHGWHRDALWAAAVAIDYAGPGLLTRARLRGLQQVAVAHFAERYGLFVIICLGESVVGIGVGASGQALSGEVVATVGLGILITAGLWWTYFGRFAATAEVRLRQHHDPVLAASDAYSYLHLLLVAGIIIFAVGVKLSLHDVGQPLADAPRLALCGGIALYLLGHAAFRLRLAGSVNRGQIAFAGAMLALFGLGSELPAWALLSVAAALLAALCALDATLEQRREHVLR